MTVIYNTNYTHNANAYLTVAILDAAKKVFGSQNVELADNRSLAGIAASGRHDVLLCLDGQRMHEGLLRRVRSSFPTMVLWLFEDPFMLDYNVERSELFDRIYTNDPACVTAYGSKGAYLPLAASERLHMRTVKADEDLEYDIFFAGTMWPNRVRSLRRIIAGFPNARLKLVCPINEFLPPLPSDLAKLAIQWPVSHEAFIDFANASRVTLTMFRDYASHGNVGTATAPGPRLYELGLAGTAQVVEISEHMDPSRFAVIPGLDVVSDIPRLVSSVKALLDDPINRSQRATMTQAAIGSSQLYTDRIESIRRDVGADFTSHDAVISETITTRKLRVLMCTHSTIRNPEWGGVEVYQQTVASMFEREVETFYWLRRGGQATLTDASGEVLERFDMPDVGWLDSLTDASEEMAFSNVIGHYGFDLVHFQHLGHHTSSLPIIAKAAGLGTVFSVHDFYLVCSRYNLLNYEQTFCNIGEKSISACDVCLRISEHVPPGAQETRRAFMGEVIRSIDTFLFGTRHSERLSLQIYPQLEQCRRAVLGIPMPSSRRPNVPDRVEALGAPLVVAVVGNFIRSKGADAIINLIEEANSELFRFEILGHPHGEYAAVLDRAARGNVKVHGRYAPGHLEVLGKADVALHLSTWPETYCISLSEAWQHGLIPIVTDIGALGDRVSHGVNGFKVAVGDVSAVLDYLELLRADPARRRAMRANIGPELWTDYRGYARTLLDIYRQSVPARSLDKAGLSLDVGQVHLLPHPSWRNLAPPRHIFDPSRRSAVTLELPQNIQEWSNIQGSELYIDSVAGLEPVDLRKGKFQPVERLNIYGWTFVPGTQMAGQVVLALSGTSGMPVIFFPAVRGNRDDLLAVFPGAPRHSGFVADLELKGKWCEGRYRVALINVLGDYASFHLTELEVTVKDGRFTEVEIFPPTNDEIVEAFYNVSRQNGENYDAPSTTLPVAVKHWGPTQQIAFHIDAATGLIEESAKMADDQAELAEGGFWLRGWAFVPGRRLAGHLYLGVFDLDRGLCAYVPTCRQIRPDVRVHFPDAPLCSGFTAQLRPASGLEAGTYVCCLVNVIKGEHYAQLLPFSVIVLDGLVVATTVTELDDALVSRVQALFRDAAPVRDGVEELGLDVESVRPAAGLLGAESEADDLPDRPTRSRRRRTLVKG